MLAQVNPSGGFCINIFEFYPNNTNTLSRVGQESDAVFLCCRFSIVMI